MIYRVRVLSLAGVLLMGLCAVACSKRNSSTTAGSQGSGSAGSPSPGTSADAGKASSFADDVSAPGADSSVNSTESAAKTAKLGSGQGCLKFPKNIPKPGTGKRLLHDVKATLFAMENCPVSDGKFGDVEKTCLAPHRQARKKLRKVKSVKVAKKVGADNDEVTLEWKAKRALWDKLVPIYRCGLMHPSQMVRYWSIYFGQGEFKENRTTQTVLRKLMFDSSPSIAVRAAAARFWRARIEDKGTQELALKTLASHRNQLVREKACRYLSAPVFKGNRPIFDALYGFAGNTQEHRIIRRCAIAGMGMLGNDSDIPAIVIFLTDLDLQKAAVIALKRGIRTSRAIDAYITYFLTHSHKPSRISWYALDALLPYDEDIPKVPKQKTITTLSNVLTTKDFHQFAREYAARDLARLLAVDELQGAAQLYADAVDTDDITVKSAIDKALKKARQQQAAGSLPPTTAP